MVCKDRVIQIWQKWQTLYFSTFLARFRIFWKMMFGKMQRLFLYDHSNACQKCSKVLLHNAPMWIRAKQKIEFYEVFFRKENRILPFENFFYIKNAVFWATLSWCSSKIELLEGVLKSCDCRLWVPLTLYQILSYINMMYLKRSHFLCRQSIQTEKFYLFLKNQIKIEFSILLYFT